MYLTFMRHKGVVSGCDGDVGDADLVKLVSILGSSVVLIHTRVTKQRHRQTIIKLGNCFGL